MPPHTIPSLHVFDDVVIHGVLPCGLAARIVYPADVIGDEPAQLGRAALCVGVEMAGPVGLP